MKVSVLNKEGKDTGRKADLKDSIFSIEPNDHAIYLDVKQTQANKRQGTHKAKERGEVAGSRKKLKRQKGTGTARVGDIKNPLFRGGGRVFGPKPRTYDSKLNKKVKQLARFSALSYKVKNKELFVLEDLKFDAPKTKEFVNVLNSLKVADKKALVVLAEKTDSVFLSSRNVQNSKVILSSELNTYDIMNASALILCEGSLEGIQQNA